MGNMCMFTKTSTLLLFPLTQRRQTSSTIGNREIESFFCLCVYICHAIVPTLTKSLETMLCTHKLTIKYSWFCFVITYVWCQAGCNVIFLYSLIICLWGSHFWGPTVHMFFVLFIVWKLVGDAAESCSVLVR